MNPRFKSLPKEASDSFSSVGVKSNKNKYYSILVSWFPEKRYENVTFWEQMEITHETQISAVVVVQMTHLKH